MLQHHSMPIKTVETVDTMADTPTIVDEEDMVCNAEEIGAVTKVIGYRYKSDLTKYCWTHRTCAHPSKTAGPRKNATRRTQCDEIKFRGAIETAPNRSG